MEILIILKWLIITGAAFYFIVHIGLAIGIKICKQAKNSLQPLVSIIVAARNEEKTIGTLLDCLINQTYSNYEIIIINDRSTDNTAAIIADFQKKNPLIKRIDITVVPDDMPAKKNALRAGIETSKGEILVLPMRIVSLLPPGCRN